MCFVSEAIKQIDDTILHWPPQPDALDRLRKSLILVKSDLSSSEVGSLRQVVATNVIDRTFDDHRALLRKRLEEAEEELRRLRSGASILEIEAERDEAIERISSLSLLIAQSSSEVSRLKRTIQRIEADKSEVELLQPTHFFRMMLHLVTLFSIGDLWQDAVSGALSECVGSVRFVQLKGACAESRAQTKQPKAIKNTPTEEVRSVSVEVVAYGSGASSVSQMPILPRLPQRGKSTSRVVTARLAR